MIWRGLERSEAHNEFIQEANQKLRLTNIAS